MAFMVYSTAGTIQSDSGYPLRITGIVSTFYNEFILPQLFVANKTIHQSSVTYATNQNN